MINVLLLLTILLDVSLFFKQEMELSLVGLQNAGKTSLLNSIAVSEPKNPLHILSGICGYLLILILLCFTRQGATVRTWFQLYVSLPWKSLIKLSVIIRFYENNMLNNQVGFNMRKVTKGNVTIKLWDLGGQRRFRTMWERYCRGVSAIV